MSTKKEVKEKVDKIDNTEVRDWKTISLHTLSITALPFIGLHAAVPLFLGATAYNLYEEYKGKQDLLDKPMPDEWLQRVSEDKNISEKGFSFLAKKIKEKGFVSIDDSHDWLKIEEKEIQKKEAILEKERLSKEKEGNLENKGAISILERAKETTDIFDEISVDTAIKELKKISDGITSIFTKK